MPNRNQDGFQLESISPPSSNTSLSLAAEQADGGNSEQVERLLKENEELRAQLEAAQNEMLEVKERLVTLQGVRQREGVKRRERELAFQGLIKRYQEANLHLRKRPQAPEERQTALREVSNCVPMAVAFSPVKPAVASSQTPEAKLASQEAALAAFEPVPLVGNHHCLFGSPAKRVNMGGQGAAVVSTQSLRS